MILRVHPSTLKMQFLRYKISPFLAILGTSSCLDGQICLETTQNLGLTIILRDCTSSYNFQFPIYRSFYFLLTSHKKMLIKKNSPSLATSQYSCCCSTRSIELIYVTFFSQALVLIFFATIHNIRNKRVTVMMMKIIIMINTKAPFLQR